MKHSESTPPERKEYLVKAKANFSGSLFGVAFADGEARTWDVVAARECFYSGCEVTDVAAGKAWERGKTN